ncbi:MAG: glycosyltransferase [Candidatus Latescibacteria bacterium]|nr:glycosyltransferase [Candidatus Latescibacterota bacterium]
MNAAPFISIVIPTYDEPERLCAALESLAIQDYPLDDAEIIVIDDASPEPVDAQRLYRAAGSRPLQLLQHQTNQGRAIARNTGIAAAAGEIIVFLDSDMTVAPDFLRLHAQAHRQYPGAVAIGQIRFGPQIPINCFTRYIESRGVQGLHPGEAVPFKCFVTGNSSVARQLLLQVGLFDEDFRAYGGEDLELGYRLHQPRANFVYLPQALSLHHHIRPFQQILRLMYTYGHQSLPILLDKHPELAGLLRLGFLARSPLHPKSLVWRLALLPLVYYPVRWLAQCGLKHYVPDLFFDYLLWRNRTCGYLAAPSGK